MKNAKTRRVFWIAVSILIALAIFLFSSQSAEKSEELSDAFADLLHMEQREDTTRVSNQVVIFGLTLRKLAHVFLYTLLGFSLFFSYEGMKQWRVPLSAGTAYLYGVLDELHQTVSGRYGRWQDTLIDLSGVLIGIGLALLAAALFRALSRTPKGYRRDSQ